MTHNEKLMKMLRRGERVTAAKAEHMGITRLSDRVRELRQYGYPVYNNDGAYQLGIPRKVIAKAYARQGAALFA